ncbi:MAG: class I SAM-dependent methyltransferase [Bdellovibrionales bacterium]
MSELGEKTLACPLCQGWDVHAKAPEGAMSVYFRCASCDLRYLDPALRLRPEEERKRYELHTGDYADSGYRQFVSDLLASVQKWIPAGASGLDYGAGHTPVLARWLEELGYEMEIFDSFFWPREEWLKRSYLFVVCCEVAEHFFSPANEFKRMASLLQPGGWLVVKTHVLMETTDFESWYYRRDPTHVVFYTPRTMAWIANRFSLRLEVSEERLVLFQKCQT